MSEKARPSEKRLPDVDVGATDGLLSRTKFTFPTAPSDLVVRRRLLGLVDLGVRGPLTLVSAPAGMGKTTLLASWIALGHAPGPVAWMTMEPGDGEPGRSGRTSSKR